MVFALLASYLQEQLATKVVAYFALQLVVAFLLLETVNCIEHYGLQRNEADGKREPFGMMHAWNADHVAITPCWLIFSATQAITRKPGNATQHRSRCQARSYPPDTQAACCSLW